MKTTLQRSALALGPLAAVLALLRYAMQGTLTVYTDTSRAFYVADPVLGWKLTEESWFWLGLDAVAVIVAVAFATWLAAWLVKRAEGRSEAPWWRTPTRLGLIAGAVASIAAPLLVIAAMSSGLPPAGAQSFLPEIGPAAAPAASQVATAEVFKAPAGKYRIVANDANTLVAKIGAGGEVFEARFGPLTGAGQFNPAQPTSKGLNVSIAVPTTSIETGVPLRNTHSADDLKAKLHPQITLRIDALDNVTRAADASATFTATGTVSFMGISLEVPVRGTMRLLDSDSRTKLGIDAAHVFLVQGTVSVAIKDTPLDATSFDEPIIPITARFLLVHDDTQS